MVGRCTVIAGSIYWIDHGHVIAIDVGAKANEWWEVKCPKNQTFLDQLNRSLGTDLKMEDFEDEKDDHASPREH